MTRRKQAEVVEECAVKVGSWDTSHLPHDDALKVQRELVKISQWLRERAADIRAGSRSGVY